jgi:hypothetical protein
MNHLAALPDSMRMVKVLPILIRNVTELAA